MKNFQIIIKNLKTGEEIQNIKTNCIIGAIQSENEENIETISLTNCTRMQIEIAFAEIEKLKKEIKKQMILQAFSQGNSLLDKIVKELLEEGD